MAMVWHLSSSVPSLKEVQSNLDYSKCQGPQESYRIIGSSNDRKREFWDIFGKARILSSGCPPVREIWFFFKVREKSGNSVKWSGKLENLQVREKSGNFKIMFG